MYSFLILLLVFVSSCKLENVVDEVASDEREFDGVGVGLISRPPFCKKTSKKGDSLKVNFNVSIGDGTVFDKRYMEHPLIFVLGEGQVIPGFDAGLYDMCVGEWRYLSIPPKFAYGDQGLGALPSRTTLHFHVNLIGMESVPNAPSKPNIFKNIDANTDELLDKDEVENFLKSIGTKDEAGQAGMRQMLRDIFLEEDKDKNGFISHKEFSGRKHEEL